MSVLRTDGWRRFSIWDHSATVRDLYTRRARREAEEMTCAGQAAELLAPLVAPGDALLDVGCGTGYFFHALAARGIPVEYFGVDATAGFIETGRRIMPDFGLAPDRLVTARIEDLDGEVDHIVCMNVLSNLDNYHRPLERMLRIARKSVILRESLTDGARYDYVVDNYLESPEPLRVHVNAYDRTEVAAFVRSFGFAPEEVVDRRTGGRPELVIDHPHHWTFLVARREAALR